MQVEYRGFTFDTDTMAAFQTGQPWMPTIYVNPNGLCFVELWRARWEQARVRHLARGEALRFADLYGMQGLREALARPVETTGAAV